MNKKKQKTKQLEKFEKQYTKKLNKIELKKDKVFIFIISGGPGKYPHQF